MHRSLLVATVLLPLAGAGAQSAPAAHAAGRAPAPAAVVRTTSSTAAHAAARVAVLDVLFVSELANAIQPADSLVAPAASARLRAELAAAAGVSVVEPARLAAALAAPSVAAAAGGKPCAIVAACVAGVGRATGAGWVVAGRMTKISSLVWIFSGQLVDQSTGRLVLSDEYEVKGSAGDMARVGARVFARRAVQKMTGAGR